MTFTRVFGLLLGCSGGILACTAPQVGQGAQLATRH